MKSRVWWLAALLLGGMVGARAGVAGEPPAAPKVSSFAPAKDLVAQLDAYVSRLESEVQSEDEFKDTQGKLLKEANTLILIGLALGLHDEANPYQAAAGAIVQAAQGLAAAKDYAEAKAGVAAVRKALESKAGGAELKWGKRASLDELMKQVPTLNTALKRNTREKAFRNKSKENAGNSAVLAVIAQGSLADTSEAKSEAQVQQWYQFCTQMRDAAAAVNQAVHASDAEATAKAMKVLNKTCDDCHEVFHKEGSKSQ